MNVIVKLWDEPTHLPELANVAARQADALRGSIGRIVEVAAEALGVCGCESLTLAEQVDDVATERDQLVAEVERLTAELEKAVERQRVTAALLQDATNRLDRIHDVIIAANSP